MIEGKYLYGADADLSDVFVIRREVFVKEAGITEQEEFDGYDTMAIHGIISVAGKKLGTGRLAFDGDEFRIGHVCILREERGKGYGDFLVRMLIDKAFLAGADEIFVRTDKETAPFYESIGFIGGEGVYTNSCGMVYLDMKLNRQTLKKECTK